MNDILMDAYYLFGALWILVVVLNVYRLAQIFQFGGYNSLSYLIGLFRSGGERGYLIISVISIVLIILIPFATYLLRWGNTVAAIMAGSVLGLRLGSVALKLRRQRTNQLYVATSRDWRLLVTAVVCTLIPHAALFLFFSSGGTSQSALLSLEFGGPIALLLVPFMLPLANFINRPIERLFRARPIVPHSQGSNL